MILSAKEKEDDEEPVMPRHKGKRMNVSSTIAELKDAKSATNFDMWLHISCIGNNIIIDIPLKKHKHFNELSERGKRLESYIITMEYVQFCFEIDIGSKMKPTACIGIDSGIKSLASTSYGKQFGTDIEAHINRVKRCKHGSKGQKRAARALRQRMDECADEVTDNVTLVVVENLKNITKNTKTKRRLGKDMRRSLGKWNIRYWLGKVESKCQDKNVSFRTVAPYYTSQECSFCGHTERRNRKGEIFKCRKCGYTGNADINAAKNILNRFLTGPYGAGCKEYTDAH
jgi:IS605 OrfB family transposase